MFLNFNKVYFGIDAPVVPVIPLIAAGVTAATGIAMGLSRGGKAPKAPEIRLPKPPPPPPPPQAPPPSASPAQELGAIDNEADRARARAIAAERRKRGRVASILTSALGTPQPTANTNKPYLGS